MSGALVNIKECDQMDTLFTNKARYLYTWKDCQSSLSSLNLDAIYPYCRVVISNCYSIQFFCNCFFYDLFKELRFCRGNPPTQVYECADRVS